MAIPSGARNSGFLFIIFAACWFAVGAVAQERGAVVGSPDGIREAVIPQGLSPIEAAHVSRSAAPSSFTGGRAGWETIFATDFSSDPIDVLFDIFDNSETGQVWGDAPADNGCPTASGFFSAGIAQGGPNGVACGVPYDPGIATIARYGPFDLSDAEQAEVVFKLWMDMDVPFHSFSVSASRNGTNFWLQSRTTNTSGFEEMVLDLTTFPVDGTPVIGESQVWIAFWAQGDGEGGENLGAFIDEIEIRKLVASTEPQIAVHPTSLTITEPGARMWTPEPGFLRIDLDEPLDDHVPGRVIVGFRPGLDVDERSLTTSVASLDRLIADVDATEMRPLFLPTPAARSAHEAHGFDRVYVMEFGAPRDVRDVIRALEEMPEVEFAEPDLLQQLYEEPPERSIPPNDPQYPSQWGLKNTGQAVTPGGTLVGTPGSDINVEHAWQITTGDSDIVIAILDTGVDLAHPEFAGRLTPGWDFIADDNDPNPTPEGHPHGTSVAGVASAAGNNGIGMAGVAWATRIMPLKVCAGQSCPNTASTAAITWAVDNGADIINLSLGGVTPSPLQEAAVNYAHASGVTVIAAAGNANNTIPNYPAAFANSISVGAMSPCDTRKTTTSCDGETFWGSSYGAGVDFVAPGVRIHTTRINGYTSTFNGTSAASPFAAGIAGLLLSADPTLTPDEVRSIMQSTAVDLGPPGYDIETGFGRLNAGAAVQAVAGAGSGFFTITNEGGGSLQVSSMSSSAAWLSLDPGAPLTIAGGESRFVSLTVDWSQLSVESTATITIISNDASTPSVQVAVTAVPAASPPVASFNPAISEGLSATLEAGATADRVLAVTNSGGQPLEFSFPTSASARNAGFVTAVSPSAATVAPGATAEVTVSFSAAGFAPGIHAGELQILTNEPGTYQYPVTMEVTPPPPPQAAVSPASLTFALQVGEDDSASVTLSNEAASGAEALTFTASVQAGDAVRQPLLGVSPGSGSVAAGSSEALTVTVDAAAETGSFVYELVVSTNDPDNAEIAVPVTVVVSPEDLAVPVTLADGWNILSVPVAAADMAAGALFPEATSSFYAFGGTYETATTLAPGTGYWARFDDALTTTLTGAPVTPRTVHVSEGWNLIGLFETEVPTGDLSTSPSDIIGSNVFSFDESYQITDSLVPGRGYWVFVSEDGVINADPALQRAADGDAGLPLLGRMEEDEVGSLAVTDAAGRSATLHFVLGGADGAHYLLPPPPPEGVFDVRFATDRSGADLGIGMWEVRLAGASLPATIVMEGLPGTLRLQDGINGGLFDVELQDGQAASLDVPLPNLHLTYVAIPDGEDLPVEFELGAAYPNPASTSVRIGYSLPEASRVRLAVYDVLGRLILPLIDDEVDAGVHEIAVPVDGLASGVYLYRIEAGIHSASRRLTIAR